MSTATDSVETDAEHETRHPSDLDYVKIAILLGVITALEVATYWLELNNFVIVALWGMMIVKFVIVISYFMHLKYDSKIFRWLFLGGLFMALAVYVVAFAASGFFVGDWIG
ncbi:MAG TPA: cytochrome C oxidase subunit IV family protein [Acidimicrobiales bacterium]|nr:cytochrome C oxidase subunit IV family protein [Acidimicrobiales bacterium]